MIKDVNEIRFKLMKQELVRFMLNYKFALEEISTKINILMQEFQYIHDYNPIEHVKSRLKSVDSLFSKVQRKGFEPTFGTIRENIRDIAGVRITCSYVSDIYKISEMLGKQKDINVIEVKDYIKNPKSNGYRSLHMVITIPIFMSDRVEEVFVELQIRTIAMDFWASLEHKIYYKYNSEIPSHIKDELKEAADTATELDVKMERLQLEMLEIKGEANDEDGLSNLLPGDNPLDQSIGFLMEKLK